MSAAARYAAHGMIGLRCFITGNVVSVSLDDIACVRTAIDERPHIGLAVSNEFDVSLTISRRPKPEPKLGAWDLLWLGSGRLWLSVTRQ